MTTATIDELLREESWVRALARRLVSDEARADDLVQETWVAALQRPPRAGTSLRPWLATVIRNRVRQDVRGGLRRRAREEDRFDDREVPSPDDLAELADQQRRVVQAVLALGQPHRNTVLLHYYGGLAPREIAKREGIPASTVRTQLSDARKRLRHRLDREAGGDGQAWVLHLIPLAVGGSPKGLAGMGTAAAGGLFLFALSTLVPLGLWWKFSGGPGTDPGADPGAEGIAGTAVAESSGEAVDPDSGMPPPLEVEAGNTRTALEDPATGGNSAALGTRTWLRVIDLEGRGIEGVEVSAAFDGNGTRHGVLTDREGFARRPDDLRSPRDLRVRGEGWLEWRRAAARRVEEVTLEATTELVGRVVHPEGEGGIEGVRIEAQRFCGEHEHGWSTWTRGDGGFRLEGVPAGVEFDLVLVGRHGVERSFVLILEDPERNHRVFSLPSPRRVRGQVIAAESGHPLAGAELFDASDPEGEARSLGHTDADGAFDVRVARTEGLDSIELLIRAAGRCSLRARPTGSELDAERPWTLPLYLPTRVEGRVLDDRGQGVSFVDVEAWVGDHEVDVAVLREASGGSFDPQGQLGDTWRVGVAETPRSYRSDPEGGFELGGLVPHHPWVTLEADVFEAQGIVRLEALAGPGETLHVDIVAQGKGAIEGILRVNGERTGGVISVFDSAGMKTSVRAKANGRFQVVEIPSGPARLAALVERFGYPPEEYMIEVEVEPGAFVRQDIDYRFEYLELAGIVIDRAGEPVPGQTVRLEGDGNPSWSDTTTSDDGGRFRFEAPDRFAPYSISVDEDLGKTKLAPLSRSDTDLVFRAESRAEVEVLIHHRGTHEPIPRVDLFWRRDSTARYRPVDPENLGPVQAEGWRTLSLPTGEIELWVQPHALELQPRRIEPWALQGGPENPPRTLEISTGSSLDIQATPDLLAYAEPYTIWVLTPEERALFLAETQGLPTRDSEPLMCPRSNLARRILRWDRNGRARLLGLPPGPWVLLCSDPEAALHPMEGLQQATGSEPLILDLR